MSMRPFLRPLALAALLCATGATHAALTVYITAGGFAGATSAPGVDSFATLSNTSLTASPLARTAGSYGYVAAAAGGFFGGGTAGDPFLATNAPRDTITFNGFGSTVRGFAGNFFASDIAGAYAAGSVTLTVIDALGATSTQTVAATGVLTGSFIGFVSNTSLTSVTLTAVQPAVGDIWPSADNLTLALAPAPVPEPASVALLLAGLGMIGVSARRRG